ncbi:transposase [Rhodocytophaga aerolata]|uniref:Transposase n=1 Tax=Rhodocytophaga aerolata TaxID=455078 RepID=A0ABT8RHG9_9BACT|nr:transposase [Rhodocytophaga aerolata]MDO1451515.1 transposase [Rhodocytophaga aerolata]
MSKLKQSVGFDLSKDRLDVCFSIIDTSQKVTIKATHKFANQLSGFQELDKWVAKHSDPVLPLVYVMEATGVYYEQLAWYLYGRAQKVSVILPTKGRQYAQSLGLKSKNDKIDAVGLARMGAEQNLPLWQPMSKVFCHLRILTREHESLQQTKNILNNQLHALSHAQFKSKSTQKRLLSMIKLIDKQLESIGQEIHHIVESDAELKRKLQYITQIKGVGMLSAVTIIAETNGFTLFENQKQLISYAGYDVIEKQSGKRIGKTKISKKGNYRIRRILHLPAFNVVRYERGSFKIFFDRLIDKGKKKMQAYVAIQKKLLVVMYTLWKKDTPFNANHEIKTASGNKEPKPLFPVVFKENQLTPSTSKEVAPTSRATQDELPCNKSPEALFPVRQRY